MKLRYTLALFVALGGVSPCFGQALPTPNYHGLKIDGVAQMPCPTTVTGILVGQGTSPCRVGSSSDLPFTQSGSSIVRDANAKLQEIPISPDDFCSGLCSGDSTFAVQAAINQAIAQIRPLSINRTYSVSHVSVTSPALRVVGTGALIGNATSATSSVLELASGNISFANLLTVSGNYSLNYSEAILVHGNSQYTFINNLSAIGAQVGFQFGDSTSPSALISEITVSGGYTYGCPIPAKVYGVETNLTVIGAQWSSDNFGVPSGQASAWAALPHRGLVAIGGTINYNGGELIMTSIAGQHLIEMQPMTGVNGEGTVWPRVSLNSVLSETASPLAITANPNNLAITVPPPGGARGLLSLIGVQGYVSTDDAPFITTSADFNGEIIGKDLIFFHPGSVRTNQNIVAGSTNTDVYLDDHGFGTNFKDTLAGTSGGVVHFSKRLIFSGNVLNGQSLPASATTLLFGSVDSTANLARFTSSYNPATGIFTVPPGGLKSLDICANLQTASTAANALYVSVSADGSTSPVMKSQGINGSAFTRWQYSALAAGQQIKIVVVPSAATSAAGPDYFNTFTIEAAN